jgi:hypothetical protein
MGVPRREPLYQTTARPHELYCNEVHSRILADLRDERDRLNEAILARMPFHVLSVQFLTDGGVTPTMQNNRPLRSAPGRRRLGSSLKVVARAKLYDARFHEESRVLAESCWNIYVRVRGAGVEAD